MKEGEYRVYITREDNTGIPYGYPVKFTVTPEEMKKVESFLRKLGFDNFKTVIGKTADDKN